jgi:hypothetical protein
MSTVPVYEFLAADGTGLGCGTRVEFDYWMAEGVFNDEDRLGPVLCHEPAREDAKRIAAWGIAA